MLIQSIKFRFNKYLLIRRQDKSQKLYKKEIETAHKKGASRIEIEELQHTDYFEYNMMQQELDYITTTYLLKKAKKYIIPIPNDESMWEKSDFYGRNLLTISGIYFVRSKIRDEQKEKLAIVTPWIGAIIGLIGALTGLFAILKN